MLKHVQAVNQDQEQKEAAKDFHPFRNFNMHIAD